MTKNIKIVQFFIAAVFFLLSDVALATELYIPRVNAKPGKTIEIPIMIDKTDNLAGIKMVLKYDAKVLEYISGEKTKHTSPLMHVVNDKNPGVLVIVMAGAKGIAGKDMALFTLKFKAKAGLKTKTSAGIAIRELQLMSDQLKDIECKIKINDVVVSP
jgi:hypothetical protein